MFREIKQYLRDKKSNFKTVVHVGAHLAEEKDFYEEMGVKNVLWFEANPQIYEKLVEKLKQEKSDVENRVFWYCLSDKNNEIVHFNITNHTQSSSMLKLKEHKKHYPEIVVKEIVEIPTIRYDSFVLLTSSFNFSNFSKENNFLCIDVQGAELKVLEGFGKELNNFGNVCLEVNEEELYENCPLINDIDIFMSKFNFKREYTVMTDAKWGEALYVK